MIWKQAVTIAALLAATGSAPAAAEGLALGPLATLSAESKWPTIVPRLASYTDAQKAAITDVVERSCTEHRVVERKELQDQIEQLLTPEQVIAAIRYWVPQEVQRDVRALLGRAPNPEDALDACDRPVRSIS